MSGPTSMHNAKVMNRFEMTKRLVERLKDEAVIGGIGNSNFDLSATGSKRPENFYMLGSMGLAAPIAFGVAIAQPRRKVFALEGDGSILMELGCLATIAAQGPKNLCIIIWDNGVYQITGGQGTPAAAAKSDLVAAARALGLSQSNWAADEEEFDSLVTQALEGDGPWLIGVRIDNKPGVSQTARDPSLFRDRFMRGMGAKNT